MSEPRPRLFHLDRTTDITGVSGTGRVADGVVWPDGTVSVRWRGERPSTVHWDALAHAEAVHGHGGHTRIVWDDDGSEWSAVLGEEGLVPLPPEPVDVEGGPVAAVFQVAVDPHCVLPRAALGEIADVIRAHLVFRGEES